MPFVNMNLIQKSILKKVYPKRKKNSHKGNFGRLLIIGGNSVYSGSPSLNALSAISSLKSGVDIVEIVSPKRAADIIACYSPDLITHPLNGDFISQKHLKKLFEISKNKSGFVIGGGIGRKKQTLEVVGKYLKKINIPGVIDADAIYALQNKKINLKNFVITPHMNEFFILTGEKIKENFNERIEQVKNTAKRLNTTILLKGQIDIISNGQKTAINKTGNSYMTKGGTGDTLAGILGSLIAQKNNLFDSSCSAAYINGKAGEITKKKSSFLATDLIEKIGKVVDSFS